MATLQSAIGTLRSSLGEVLALGLAGTLALAVARRAFFLRSIRHIPGPEYSFFAGAMASIRGDGTRPSMFKERHKYIRGLHKIYGPVVRIVMPAGRGAIIACADPSATIVTDSAAFPRRPPNNVLDHSLVTLPTNAEWRRHRAALAPAFTTTALRSYHPSIVARAEQLWSTVHACGKGGDVEVSKPLTATTLDVIGDVGFGVDFGALAGGSSSPFMLAGEEILGGVLLGAFLPPWVVRLSKALPLWVQPACARRLYGAYDLYTEAARSIYARARARTSTAANGVGGAHAHAPAAAEPPPPVTLLTALADAQLTFEEARDEIITLLVAGHETTSNTICWAVHLLARHPRAQAAARRDALDACAAGVPLTFEAVCRMEYVRAVVYEALRVYPTVVSVGRLVERPARVCGVLLPRGAIASHSTATVTRDTALFGEDADQFRPERQLAGRSGAAESTPAWYPFGGGPRKCIGYRLAELEAVTILATLLRSFEVLPPSDAHRAEPTETVDLTLGPKKSGLFCRLRPLEL